MASLPPDEKSDEVETLVASVVEDEKSNDVATLVEPILVEPTLVVLVDKLGNVILVEGKYLKNPLATLVLIKTIRKRKFLNFMLSLTEENQI